MVARVYRPADYPVIRTGPERQVVAVNAARRTHRIRHFIELFLDSVGAAGRKLHPAKHAAAERECFRQLPIHRKIPQQRHAPQSRLGPLLDAARAVGPPVGTID